MVVMETVVLQSVPKQKPHLEASWVPKEENRTVSMVCVLEDDHLVCNQCSQYCVAMGNP